MTPDPTLIEQELLPCPFCEQEGLMHRAPWGWQVTCSGCGVAPRNNSNANHETKAGAAKVWNTRAGQGSAALPSEAMGRVKRLLDYDFGDESPHCIALAEATGELIAMRATTPTAPDQDTGVPCGTGSRASHEASISVESSPKASIPNADDGESYRMTPQFKRFLATIGSVDRAMAAWDIAVEAFAPLTPEADFEVWQGDEMVAGCSGPRGRAIAEAVHYAVVYQTDGQPCVIQEVTRREVSPDVAHSMIASAIEAGTAKTGTGLVHESAAPQEDA